MSSCSVITISSEEDESNKSLVELDFIESAGYLLSDIALKPKYNLEIKNNNNVEIHEFYEDETDVSKNETQPLEIDEEEWLTVSSAKEYQNMLKNNYFKSAVTNQMPKEDELMIIDINVASKAVKKIIKVNNAIIKNNTSENIKKSKKKSSSYDGKKLRNRKKIKKIKYFRLCDSDESEFSITMPLEFQITSKSNLSKCCLSKIDYNRSNGQKIMSYNINDSKIFKSFVSLKKLTKIDIETAKLSIKQVYSKTRLKSYKNIIDYSEIFHDEESSSLELDSPNPRLTQKNNTDFVDDIILNETENFLFANDFNFNSINEPISLDLNEILNTSELDSLIETNKKDITISFATENFFESLKSCIVEPEPVKYNLTQNENIIEKDKRQIPETSCKSLKILKNNGISNKHTISTRKASYHTQSDKNNKYHEELSTDKVKPKYNKFRNKSSKIFTLNELEQLRKKYSFTLGTAYPYFGLDFLIKTYLDQVSQALSLDFNLLIEHLNCSDPNHLKVSLLNRNEKLELCKLMSRNLGKINLYKLFCIGSNLRENSKYYSTNTEILNKFSKEKKEINWITTMIPELTLSESFILYSHLQERLNTPYRSIVLIKCDFFVIDIKVTFENNGFIESYDSSVESCILFVLHKRKRFSYSCSVSKSLHTHYIMKSPENNNLKEIKYLQEGEQEKLKNVKAIVS